MAHDRKSIPALVLELVMIGVGVFLGATAEQWRDNRHHQEMAHASLENFRREMTANRARIANVHDYHVQLARDDGAFLKGSKAHGLQDFMAGVHWAGTRSVDFEHTAWDLAIATQALSDVKPELAYRISRVYTAQQSFGDIEKGFMASAFTPQTLANTRDAAGLALALAAYLGDVNTQEPALMKAYDTLIPKLDSALGRTR